MNNATMKNISDVCLSVCSGGTPSKKEETYYLNGTIPWLNTGEVNFNRIRKTENYITQKGLDNSSAKWVPENTVIVAMYGATASKCAIAKIPLTTNQACCNLIINNKLADYRFIYYSLKLRSKELASLANGGAQQNLNAGDIKNFEIKIPNLTTQTKIADALSIFDDKIENNNNLIKNLIEQSMSIWSLLFDESQYDDKKGWRKVFLSDITENIRERVNGRELKVLSALNSGRLMPSEEYFTKQVFSKEIDKYIVVRQNDFAYNPARINIGSIGINDLGFDGCVSPVYVVFRVENGYEHYFNIFIKTTRFKKVILYSARLCSCRLRSSSSSEARSVFFFSASSLRYAAPQRMVKVLPVISAMPPPVSTVTSPSSVRNFTSPGITSKVVLSRPGKKPIAPSAVGRTSEVTSPSNTTSRGVSKRSVKALIFEYPPPRR